MASGDIGKNCEGCIYYQLIPSKYVRGIVPACTRTDWRGIQETGPKACKDLGKPKATIKRRKADGSVGNVC